MNDSDSSLNLDTEETIRIREITPYQLASKKPLPMIIDIREEEEFMRGHIDGAKHISRLGAENSGDCTGTCHPDSRLLRCRQSRTLGR